MKTLSWIFIFICYIVYTARIAPVTAKRSSFDEMLMPDQERNTRRRISEDSDEIDGIDKSSLVIVKSVSSGLEEAVTECKNQFRWDLWNCPVTASSIVSKSTQSRATREVSFLQAISAAGTMFSVTKSCNHPDNTLCGCGEGGKFTYSSEALRWKWGGCSHNVKFGEKVSKLFLGTDAAGADIGKALKSHNERAGHKAVKRTLHTLCKCHGVTGSCQMRTCWKQLADFQEIGNHLRKKYKRAKDIRHLQGFKQQNSNKVTHPRLTRISKHDLVHFENSPNYCETDNSIGYLGTLGRECLKLEKGANRSSLTKFERNSCRRLCKNCGHSIGKYVFRETYDCDCEFKWCCSVDCKTCTRNVTKYYCK